MIPGIDKYSGKFLSQSISSTKSYNSVYTFGEFGENWKTGAFGVKKHTKIKNLWQINTDRQICNTSGVIQWSLRKFNAKS